MTAPRRCLICGSLNEPYASRCSCGASLDVSADESRRVVARAATLAGWWAALWAIVTVALIGVAIVSVAATSASRGVVLQRQAALMLGAVIGACVALGACIRAVRRWLVARANLAAIPDLPRAALRR